MAVLASFGFGQNKKKPFGRTLKLRANLLFLKNERPQMILYLAVYHSSQDFKNSDASSSEDEQEKVVQQEPPKIA